MHFRHPYSLVEALVVGVPVVVLWLVGFWLMVSGRATREQDRRGRADGDGPSREE